MLILNLYIIFSHDYGSWPGLAIDKYINMLARFEVSFLLFVWRSSYLTQSDIKHWFGFQIILY